MTAAHGTAIPFVTFACRKDVHYAKALLGSIRHFYPNNQIHVVLDDVPRRDEQQIKCFPNATTHTVSSLIKTHALPLRGLLAKLNIFFLPDVTRAIVADADSILTGPVIDIIRVDKTVHSLNSDILDLGTQAGRECFTRWAIDLPALKQREGKILTSACPFVQGSHFYVDLTAFPSEVLYRLLPDMTNTHSPTHMLRAGDQGFWNYIANFGHHYGISCAQSAATIQVGQTPHVSEYDRLSHITARNAKSFYFLHYVGFCRKYLRRQHEYSVPLRWGTRMYYKRIGLTGFVRDETSRFWDTLCRRGKNLLLARLTGIVQCA